MKKYIIAILMFLMTPTAFADTPQAPQLSGLVVHPDVMTYAIGKHIRPIYYQDVAREWGNYMDLDGHISMDGVRAICAAGHLDSAQCLDFERDLMVSFYDICDNDARKPSSGRTDCIIVFYDRVYGTWVRLPEAIGIAKEYASVKNHESIVCSSAIENTSTASYLKCTSVDGSHYYTFKFNSTKEIDDKSIIDGVIRAVAKIHNIGYHVPIGDIDAVFFGLEQSGDGTGPFSSYYSYETSDLQKCNAINNTLEKFGYSCSIYDRPDDIYGPECGASVFARSPLRTAYDINNRVFAGVQYTYDIDLEKYIKQYVQWHMNSTGQRLNTFRCAYSTQSENNRWLDANVIGGKTDRDEVLTCYVNERPVDFVFDDLSEPRKIERDSGLSQMACATLGGRYKGKECHGFNKKRCEEISSQIPGGTRWNKTAEVCILKDAALAQDISDGIRLVGDVVVTAGLTYISGGSYVLVLIAAGGAAAFDVGVAVYDQLLTANPAHRARQFAEDAQNCNIPLGSQSCTPTQAACAKQVINKHFSRLNEILDDELTQERWEAVGEITDSLFACMSDTDLVEALTTSTPMWEDKILNAGGIILMAGAIFCAPENMLTRISARSPKLARALSRCRIWDRVGSELSGARYMQIYVDNLDDFDDVNHIVEAFQHEGYYVSSNMANGKQFIAVADRNIFGPWDNAPSNWLFRRAIINPYDIDNVHQQRFLKDAAMIQDSHQMGKRIELLEREAKKQLKKKADYDAFEQMWALDNANYALIYDMQDIERNLREYGFPSTFIDELLENMRKNVEANRAKRQILQQKHPEAAAFLDQHADDTKHIMDAHLATKAAFLQKRINVVTELAGYVDKGAMERSVRNLKNDIVVNFPEKLYRKAQNWPTLSLEERKILLRDELQPFLMQIHGCDGSVCVNVEFASLNGSTGGWGVGKNRLRISDERLNDPDFTRVFSTVIHENIHMSQDVRTRITTLSKEMVEVSNINYVTWQENNNAYDMIPIEIEAYMVTNLKDVVTGEGLFSNILRDVANYHHW